MDVKGLQTLFAVSLIAALAPIICAALRRPRLPPGGRPDLLRRPDRPAGHRAPKRRSIKLISNVGLGFLFLLAGYELDPQLLRERAGKLAITGWVLSAIHRGRCRGHPRDVRLREGLRAHRAGSDHHRSRYLAADPARQQHADREVRPLRAGRRGGRRTVSDPGYIAVPDQSGRVRRGDLDRRPCVWWRCC